MKIFFDTPVLVACFVDGHPNHERAWPWLKRARAAEFEWALSAHSLAEAYATLTTLPLSTRMEPLEAAAILREDISSAEIITLSAADYRSAIQAMAEASVIGGTIYDALITKAAQKAQVDRLLTFNAKHFKLVWPQGSDIIREP